MFFTLIHAAAAAPYNGASFLKDHEPSVLPSVVVDEEDPSIIITRLLPNTANSKGAGECGGGDQANKDVCLTKQGRECMWVRVETRDPLLPVQESYAHCLPCQLDEEEIPCWNPGAWIGGFQVTDCEMKCPHQKRIRQPEHACSDESGFITNSQCFDKGTRSGSKCMFTAYKLPNGDQKSVCGPCFVTGVGGWGCPAVGDKGLEPDSKVTACVSQCDVLCMGPPACPPTVVPPPPPPPPSPGLVTTGADPKKMLLAPAPYAMPTVNPYAIAQAAMSAAKKAGWVIGTPAPPKTYYPVIIYRRPSDYLFTPSPPSMASVYSPVLAQKSLRGSAKPAEQVESMTRGASAYSAVAREENTRLRRQAFLTHMSSL